MIEFEKSFEALTGHAPFPWQRRLYEQFLANRFPRQCNLPTGLGKTSIIPIWLIALAVKPEAVPRRLVYVVNRRTVVDQATEESVKIRDRLNEPKLDALKQALSSLAVITKAGKNNDVPFAISSLRGQFADNAEWRDDPARAAVIVGTVDMIGSRLLFRGYRNGFKSQPTHAGLLGQDTLIVHDEAHLEPAFQELLVAINTCQTQEGGLIGRPSRIMELTATSRGSGDVFELNQDDRRHDVVRQRIDAGKGLAFHEGDDSGKLAGAIIDHALSLKDTQEAILIFLQSVENVTKVVAALEKENQKVEHLTGTKRGRERDQLATENRVFARFLPPSNRHVDPEEGTVYLVCTSAGEVGVNITADKYMVCDLTSFESMAQRFGRVNRFGNGDAKIDVFHEAKIDPKDEYQKSRLRTLELLKQLPKREDGRFDASPHALGELSSKLSDTQRREVFAPQPEILPVSEILFDAWTLTTIRDELPGRPPVADWLHGVPTDWEPPRTSVAWREEVERIADDSDDTLARQIPPLTREDLKDLLEAYPLKPHELLSDRTDRVFAVLKALASDHGERPIWVVSPQGKVEVQKLQDVVDDGPENLRHQTILLPPSVGGLRGGLLDGKAKPSDSGGKLDVADEWFDPAGDKRRQRLWRVGQDDKVWDQHLKDEGVKKWREVAKFALSSTEEETTDGQDAVVKVWHWFVRPRSAEDDDSFSRQAPKPQLLAAHLTSAKTYAEKIVDALKLPEPERTAVIVAAELHDLGKDRRLWQHGIGNREYDHQNPETILAKSDNTRRPANQGYRHEFGTLLELDQQESFSEQDHEVQELIRHLIAAHHGRGRPHFPRDEAFDPEAFMRAKLTLEGVADLACEVPQRFARLQRKYGRWGLAWLESLVRAADVMASRNLEES